MIGGKNMLLEFTLKNFLSIKDEITLSMVASKDSSHEDNVLSYDDGKKNALKSIIIYGANASGKSNILKAMDFVHNFIKYSHEMQQGVNIPRIPFKLDRNCLNEPSEFNIIFIQDGIKYAYGFSTTEEEVIDEYLYYYPNGRQSIIFERENVDQYKFNADKERQIEIKNKFHSKNKLFLCTESLWEYEKVIPPFKWLSQKLKILLEHENLESYTGMQLSKDENIKPVIMKYLRKADLDIYDLNVSSYDDLSSLHYAKNLPDKIKEEISSVIKNKKILDIKTTHKGLNENQETVDVEFELKEESSGTRKFFGLLGPWIDVLSNGYTIAIDELDIRLHPLLTKTLIDIFQNPKINNKGAQLIFTTHNTNLLNQELFRRDQIWFTEKKENGSTDIYSLNDFSVRKDENIEKGYLKGKYGAIPFITEGWDW